MQAEVDGLRDRQLASESELRAVSALRLMADVTIEAVRAEADAADAAVAQAMDADSCEALAVEDVVEEQRITTEKGRVMQQMFHVQVIGTWYEDLTWHERTAETWRYARLYQQ